MRLCALAVQSSTLPPMSFSALPTVLVRLVMQCCDLRSLLALARCNQHTRLAASHDAAFRALSPVTFRSTRANLAANIAGSLLRFATIGLRWTQSGSGPFQPEPDRDEMLAIASIPRLRVLDARGRRCTFFHYLPALLQHPSAPLTHLTALYTPRNGLDVECITLLATQCRSLRTLHFHVPDTVPKLQFMEQLAKLPCLTDLEWHGAVDDPAAFAPLFPYAGLCRLSLLDLSETAWQQLLLAPCTESVEHLRLGQLAVMQLSFDWPTCFTNLSALHTLELDQCGSIDLLLPAIIEHAMGLRGLVVSMGQDGLTHPSDLYEFSFPSRFGSPKPSVALLEQLIHRRSECAITIHMVSQNQYVLWGRLSVKTLRAAWSRADEEYSALAARFPSRVRVIPPPEAELADAEPQPSQPTQAATPWWL